jgi:hypothetical protein
MHDAPVVPGQACPGNGSAEPGVQRIADLNTALPVLRISYRNAQAGGHPQAFHLDCRGHFSLLGNGFDVEQIVSEGVLAKNGRLASSVDYLNENAYLLTGV